MLRTAVFLLFFYSIPCSGQGYVEKAVAFHSSLHQNQLKKVSHPFEDTERFNFNFVPLERKGLSLAELSDLQKQKAFRFLSSCLSDLGFQKVTDIISLEEILIVIEENRLKMPDGSPMRDPEKYYLSFFGSPVEDDIWAFRFEGHHVALNFTSIEGALVAATPTFLGANPGVVESGYHKGKEVLGKETTLGLKLINSMDVKQLKKAHFSTRPPGEIISRNDRRASLIEPEGIGFKDLSTTQQGVFLQLLNIYLSNYQFDFTDRFRRRVEEAGINNLSFAWAGGMERGEGHYYRIQGPILLIEYANTQNDANHVHTIVRDLENDFAEEILRLHYENEH
jgi:hypothetical protein